MSSKRDINIWFKAKNAILKQETMLKLEEVRMVPGRWVRRKYDGNVYLIHSVHFGAIEPYGGYVSLHGYKRLKDGSTGYHVHSIGFPDELDAL